MVGFQMSILCTEGFEFSGLMKPRMSTPPHHQHAAVIWDITLTAPVQGRPPVYDRKGYPTRFLFRLGYISYTVGGAEARLPGFG